MLASTLLSVSLLDAKHQVHGTTRKMLNYNQGDQPVLLIIVPCHSVLLRGKKNLILYYNDSKSVQKHEIWSHYKL